MRKVSSKTRAFRNKRGGGRFPRSAHGTGERLSILLAEPSGVVFPMTLSIGLDSLPTRTDEDEFRCREEGCSLPLKPSMWTHGPSWTHRPNPSS